MKKNTFGFSLFFSISSFLFILLGGFYSCKKDNTADYPTVQITAPYSTAIFNALGTINVQAHVSDAQTLTSVSVYVENSANTPVLPSLQIPVTSNSMNINCTYSLNDIHLNSGTYYVVVNASNGTNSLDAFQQIFIDGVPTKRTAIYAITRNRGGVHVWKIDSAFNVSLSYTVTGDFSSSDISSYYQQLYTTGLDSGSAAAYSVPAATQAWSVSGMISPSPYFTNIYYNGDAAFVSCYLGFIRYYNHEGALMQTYSTLSGYEPIKTYLWNGFLLSQEKAIAASLTYLVTYYQGSGVTYQQTLLPGPLVAMYGYDNTHVFVFGNTPSGSPYLQLYNMVGNVFYSPIPLPSSQILSVAQINPNSYLIGFNNGNVYQYNYTQSGMVSYIGGLTASCIRYDSIDNEILISSGKEVREYSLNNPILISSATLSDSVRDVRILFNK